MTDAEPLAPPIRRSIFWSHPVDARQNMSLMRRLLEPGANTLLWSAVVYWALSSQLFAWEPFGYEDGSMYWVLGLGVIINLSVGYGIAWNMSGLVQRQTAPMMRVVATIFGAIFLAGFAKLIVNRVLLFFVQPNLVWDVAGALDILWMGSIVAAEYAAFGVAYGLIKMWFVQDFIRQKLEKKQVETELALLRAQVDPHFLFNTLNGLYALAQKEGAADTSNGIMHLADMMRFVIYEAGQAWVPLARETEYISHYIELQRLRSGPANVVINFNQKGKLDQPSVPPLILLGLVENAFKHGLSFRQSPCRISFLLTVCESGEVHFKAENTIRDTPAESSNHGGFGVANLKERLALIYGRDDLFVCRHEGPCFVAELFLPARP